MTVQIGCIIKFDFCIHRLIIARCQIKFSRTKILHNEEENVLCPTITTEAASSDAHYGSKNANIRRIHAYFVAGTST